MRPTVPLLAAAALVGIGALAPTTAEATRWGQSWSMKERIKFNVVMYGLDAADRDVDAWAVEPDGDWIVVSGTDVWHSAGMDSTITIGVKLNIWFGRTIYEIDCRDDGLCVAIHSMGILANGALPAGLSYRVNQWISVYHLEIRDFELSDTGWLIVGPGSLAAYKDLPAGLGEAIYDRRASKRQLRDVAIGFDGEWALLADNNPMTSDAPAGLESRLWTTSSSGIDVDRILLGRGSDWFAYNGDDNVVAPDLTDPIQAMEYALGPADNETIWDRMDDLGVPGIAIALIEDGEVVSARGYGLARDDDDRPILASTPWDVASLSKYAGALTTLATMEDYGWLDLDDDAIASAGSRGTVAAWVDRIANDKGSYGFPSGIDDVPSSGITYRQLLSHTGGMVTRGSTPIPEYNQDTWADQDTLTFLSGYSCLFNGTPGDCTWSTGRSAYYAGSTLGAPGVQYNYANSGFFLVQASLEDITGDEGSDLMADHLFGPMGLTDSTGEYPLPDAFVDRVVGHHDETGGQAYQATYPWTFAGGLTASVADYAELVVVGVNDGESSDGVTVLSSASVDQLLTRVSYSNYATDPNATNYALGIGVGNLGVDDYAGNDDGVFRHSGSHPSRVSTWMCGNPTRGEGLVVFINVDDGLPSGGGGVVDLRNEIRGAFNSVNGWPSGC
jgi:CubicO group peptidase (beta-lactamase class C family)